ncbi:bifunctional (p)ppGpp synthetase/guanosine-3',5'-bis(diphosphate) 3'-pyrophosphohydrolase [Clostridium tertium]|jgi:GTP pyrophosphokinase|uniref:GTP diphosphokinase n=3 Tax=Clostridium tertium TaxID=1559 RepID=A0A9X3XKM0_9CLOT|nr:MULTISPECIES: bifunctional (p)ppGpp synthetase/guanosine-3',5'-bis(diphosphate) 3'-pyrophosphohydrolase [Clostridium]EEH97511.1 RelA/SpoT family protein [Clostridium sp. 7_2_43FAA]MBP1868593.1 GTP pyrophosphokinase [Clostridium tertium]MBS5306292.1 bifunctional (p)ppGpp synthetase/guanosine-3',5'-bis(diphosphate) 3'-pyrophosphohydrolase [Clostridium sp.]MBU6135010.1 bifunctional (p)ppGpp synthetase/guanosine-3',5'-bis(diphosphate) 3'-pyrophosphohydrolase [Clostridium tertium]MDB1922202.1 bi
MYEGLLRKINENCNNIDTDIVKKAYDLACDAHKNQKRESGEPYITHPIDVAEILAEMGMDTSTIVAGLLHDVIEDTHYTYDDIKNIFNEEVADLVQGVTKLGKIEYKTKEEQQADNVRKMLLAMAKDIRVIIIKLADRLHNLRTLKFMPKEKQKQKAKETLDIYAPLAHRLGISKIKWELEDLAFRYLHEEEYYDLVKQIAEKRVERETYIAEIIEDLHNKLEESEIDSDIDGRPKHFYSIYKKMINKNKSIEQIFDLTAIRILVNTVKDCYGVLGIVHTIYKPIPGRFKDYIAMPKPNMYQSLHTTVIGPQGKTFEIQIRTFEMHKTAEYGIAAHWKYKEGDTQEDKEKSFENKLAWLRDMLEWQKETSDAEEFIEGFKIDLFTDEIFVFTPKGVVINLPSGATPIDFAYRIHTDIGNRCIGSKVNGKIVPLDYNLKTGEIVEVLTSNNAKGPNMDWLNMAKSNQAKSKIRQWFKKIKKEENIDKGKEVFEKELKKQGVIYSEIAKGEAYEKSVKRYNIHSMEDLYASIGVGQISASSYIAKLKEENITEKQSLESINKSIDDHISKSDKANINKKTSSNDYGVTVKGVNNLMVRFARCCNPVPGDEILGYITKGRGISVHRSDCSNLKALIDYDNGKVVEVSWGSSKGTAYVAEIQVRAEDRIGILSDIMMIITEAKLPLNALNAKSSKGNIAIINIKVKIDSIEQLRELMRKIRRLKGVMDVYRMNN